MKKHVLVLTITLALLLPQMLLAADPPTVSTAEGPIEIINLYDLEKAASQKVPKGAFGYVQGGAEDEVTLRDNTSAFDKKRILPNGLTGLESVDTKTQFLGIDLPSPIIMAPTAAHGMVHKEADRATIKGTQKAGTIMSISNYSSVPMAETVNGRVPIVFDSGVRRGTHVFKALASGADIVAIGRPALYGLILGGSEGVNDVFQQLNKELSTTMTLAGTKDIAAVKKNKLFDPED